MKKEEILKFYQDYRLFIFPAIVALSSLILIIFVIYPQAVKLITNNKIEGEIINKSDLLSSKTQALESLDPADLKTKVDYLLYSYPTDKDFVSAMALLQNLTQSAGFNVVSMSLGSSSQAAATDQSYSLKLDILGSTTQLPILLSSIESSARLMRVSNVEVVTGKDAQGVSISLNVDVLYSAAPKEFGSIDSPLPALSDKDEEIIASLARAGISAGSQVSQSTAPLGPRGKVNPFE